MDKLKLQEYIDSSCRDYFGKISAIEISLILEQCGKTLTWEEKLSLYCQSVYNPKFDNSLKYRTFKL